MEASKGVRQAPGEEAGSGAVVERTPIGYALAYSPKWNTERARTTAS
ncbi:hypothetical protein [Rhizobium mongolense]|uniref:Uncharacterized protein n=1 Tax=Rhizobium mongolense TaxID=57676 RepID=A0ABR6IJB1_9HYPH|nr:hypothetical protein [Rhizobium mongolense]MBB4227962.1 hypothetical protein [Rhizobium mongolense]